MAVQCKAQGARPCLDAVGHEVLGVPGGLGIPLAEVLKVRDLWEPGREGRECGVAGEGAEASALRRGYGSRRGEGAGKIRGSGGVRHAGWGRLALREVETVSSGAPNTRESECAAGVFVRNERRLAAAPRVETPDHVRARRPNADQRLTHHPTSHVPAPSCSDEPRQPFVPREKYYPFRVSEKL